MHSHFRARLASRIKFLVGSIIQREIADPRLGLVTVLNVEPTPDLKEAKVYISIFGKQGDRSKTLHALEDARGHIQKELGKNLETRYTPRLSFILDESQDKVSRIEALVEQAKEEREDVMAKKPGKKDEKASKGAKKAQKSAAKPQKPQKSASAGSPRVGGPKEAAGVKDAKSSQKPKPRMKKDEDLDEGGGRKDFMADDMPEEDEDKDFVDDIDSDDDEDEEEDEAEEEDDDEAEEEEEERDEDY